ncbi:hypothetical protein KP77_27010 [Jeotgalibacillus alimentarius]|uniref:Uncharacterized protein n=2 Tax=Jeotgalibacillus alimentarius TaxID=135826 RepID=A0A0C2RXT2_9BACL|nr:hypothetical protein KP77_27010 [Jeotgalibacillus alimentarius]
MEDCLYAMKKVAVQASQKGLTAEVRKDLKVKMRLLIEELDFLEQQRVPFDGFAPFIH